MFYQHKRSYVRVARLHRTTKLTSSKHALAWVYEFAGLEPRIGLLEWTTGMDYWNGPLEWTTGLVDYWTDL